jgi:hypothetical protein
MNGVMRHLRLLHNPSFFGSSYRRGRSDISERRRQNPQLGATSQILFRFRCLDGGRYWD